MCRQACLQRAHSGLVAPRLGVTDGQPLRCIRERRAQLRDLARHQGGLAAARAAVRAAAHTATAASCSTAGLSLQQPRPEALQLLAELLGSCRPSAMSYYRLQRQCL
eukprot:96855-Chlamydomonas_euryale.AAC.2